MSVQMLLKIAVCVIVPYLLGSVSVGILVGKRNGHDIRNEGSRNTGASNVLRSVGIRAAAVTFLGDFLKAALAVLLGQALLSRDGGMLAGLFVIIGHNWPVFFSFRGGKGIACSAAVLLMTFFWQGAAAAILCLIVIWLTRYISVGSLTLVSVFTVLLFITEGVWPCGVWALALAVMAFIRHRANLVRLRQGTENKITFHRR
ncbi:MAG: glycerol-3-phosphate 1-O-acyltransferase PlsY [Clostridia bacterium]|nr:glycerol-3-phosphate 1-O-acyltransferase PlsY [Clostridia bacterium]